MSYEAFRATKLPTSGHAGDTHRTDAAVPHPQVLLPSVLRCTTALGALISGARLLHFQSCLRLQRTRFPVVLKHTAQRLRLRHDSGDQELSGFSFVDYGSNMRTYDLRSDTVTRPSAAMRAAMAAAEVGDDVYGEDPTVQRLESVVADLLGKESALFVPSGTMANQIALLVHTRPGDEVIVGQNAHCANFEAGAGAAWAGVQFAAAGHGGLFSAAEAEAALRPSAEQFPKSSLVVLENTHNLGGGVLFPQADCEAIAQLARARGLGVHLDGARIWNAAVASGLSTKALADPFDTVSVCFSKGLGAPVGSAFIGSRELVRAARRFRKMLGGAMRQSGVLAAAALYALQHQRARIEEDHVAARAFAGRLQDCPGTEIPHVQTNIVLIHTPGADARSIAERAAAQGVLLHAIGPHTLRAVTHLDLTESCVRAAADVLRPLLAV